MVTMVRRPQIAIRLDADLLDLADEVATLAAKASALDEPSRAAVLRTALRRGLEEMRAELKARLKRK
jgi:hypothetical protein